jgi:hypothetical protein
MANRYEIEEGTHAIRVYYDGADVPGLYQPHWPNGMPWASAEEAEEWAQLFIASIEDEAAPYAPGGPGEPGTPKPTPEEIAAMQAEMEAREAEMEALRNAELPPAE